MMELGPTCSLSQFCFFPCGKCSKDLSGNSQKFQTYVIIPFALLVRILSLPNISTQNIWNWIAQTLVCYMILLAPIIPAPAS